MLFRVSWLASVVAIAGLSQVPSSQLTFGGSGNDSINAITVDAAGNIYVVGTTTSFDLPVSNAFQGANSGTQLVVSRDSGATWHALANPFPKATFLQPVSVAVDPSNGQIVYAAAANSVCKSIDGGNNFQCATLFASNTGTINFVVVDPRQPATLYVGASSSARVWKSSDGGQTWSNASQGLPSPGFVVSVVVDPFHSNVLYAWANDGGYVSTNGAASWVRSSLPWPQVNSSCGGFSFDPVKTGIVYGPWFATGGANGVQRSTDGGATWTFLSTPFQTCSVTPDPKTSGALYALDANTFWRSGDGGVTWTSSVLPAGIVSPLAADPDNPGVLLAGAYRSADGGQTWSPSNVSRSFQPAFAPSTPGLIYAAAAMSADAFVAKFLPDAQTLVFATYFGGMGDETGTGIALDSAGNVWIGGTTYSYDLPVTPGALQSTLGAALNSFAAKFSSDGALLASTYLGGSGAEAGRGIAVDPGGHPWAAGETTTGVGIVRELDPEASQVLYAANLPGSLDSNGHGIAIDPAGDAVLAGTLNGPGGAFVLKLDPSGQVKYSAALGGSRPASLNGMEGARDFGVAVAVDADGNAYLTGNTSSADFPTTSRAYQRVVSAACSYSAFSVTTGIIGTIEEWLIDDAFVVKLGPDGSMVYATLLGGSCYDRPTSITVDSLGQATIAGETDSGDFPQVGSLQSAPATRQFASFVATLSADGSTLPFSTYFYAGSAPSVVAVPGGSIVVVGSAGIGAQSQPNTGVYYEFQPMYLDGFLGLIGLFPAR